MTPLYLDAHVPFAIRDQLRRRGIDVLSALDDGGATLSDAALLERSTGLGRVMFTQDVGFKALAEHYQAEGHRFAGLIFGHQLRGSIGQFVRDLCPRCMTNRQTTRTPISRR